MNRAKLKQLAVLLGALATIAGSGGAVWKSGSEPKAEQGYDLLRAEVQRLDRQVAQLYQLIVISSSLHAQPSVASGLPPLPPVMAGDDEGLPPEDTAGAGELAPPAGRGDEPPPELPEPPIGLPPAAAEAARAFLEQVQAEPLPDDVAGD